MNASYEKPPRTYIAHLKTNEKTVQTLIKAADRRQAVKKALNWFWYEFRGALGPAHKVMTVNDPYHEVRYGPKFMCNDRMNKLLPLDVCLRLFKESKGELVIDRSEGKKYHQPNSMRRVKRRRDFGRFIAPNVKQMKNGVLYYRVNTRPQVSHDGRRYRKRKYRDIRLESKTLMDAIAEIEARELHKLHAQKSVKKTAVREFNVLAHVAGVIELDQHERKKFARAIRRYETPPSSTAA